VILDWRDLPYREIWCIDFEFYPGPGLATGGREGDAPTPLCLVGLEMRSGRTVRQWCDEFGRFPPYRLDDGALIVGYNISAEFGCHIALGWGQPARALDAYIEFRHCMNDGAAKAADRPKGTFSLAGALRHFRVDEIDTTRKDKVRDRILQGPPFTAEERVDILDYCTDDVRALARLIPRLVPTIPSLPHALFRARYAWAIAQEERRGVPFDVSSFVATREHWNNIQCDLVTELDAPFGVYEIVDGVPHCRIERFVDYLRRNGMAWPTLESGAPDMRDETFREMAGKYPQIEQFRELRYSLSKLKLNDLQVGSDGRARTLLSPYGTKTARNAPSNSRYVFGPAKWIRFFIAPPPGHGLIHRDFAQQEPRIAAVLSGDEALLRAVESGDVYLGIAEQLGFLRESMSKEERKGVRILFKVVVLGIMYGLGPYSLAVRAGISLFEACEILARLRAQFRRFEEYAESVLDHAGIFGEITTQLGWRMQCPSLIKRRTVRNFPIQSTGSEILHVASILAERRRIQVCAPVHDAIMAEAQLDQLDDVSTALDRIMRDASAIVLKGYELPTELGGTKEGGRPILPGERYYDERGEAMWNTVSRLVEKLGRTAAQNA
jgi:DNA polymerase-1